MEAARLNQDVALDRAGITVFCDIALIAATRQVNAAVRPGRRKLMAAATHFCPCCGYPGLRVPAYDGLNPPPWGDLGGPPYGPRLGAPSYDVCDCCGIEFGFDDEPGAGSGVSFTEYRRDWIAGGCEWFDPQKRPPGWSLEEQLQVVGIECRA